ncbi:MAG: hypothetical protein WCX71_02705 [Candidatus Buchananbacteria bacterium]
MPKSSRQKKGGRNGHSDKGHNRPRQNQIQSRVVQPVTVASLTNDSSSHGGLSKNAKAVGPVVEKKSVRPWSDLIKMKPGVTHYRQAQASARKKYRRKERYERLQKKASDRKISVRALLAEQYAEASEILAAPKRREAERRKLAAEQASLDAARRKRAAELHKDEVAEFVRMHGCRPSWA